MKALTISLIMLMSASANAQTWAEFFRQKKTQKEYLIKQITALKLYAGYLKKGYDITNEGLRTIKNISKGELNLHSDYLNSLKAVNPSVSQNFKIAEILSLQIEVAKNLRFRKLNADFQSEERKYFESVWSNLQAESRHDLDELFLLITAGKFEMTDEERLYRLDGIHKRMIDKYEFSQSFLNQVNLLKLQRDQETRNIEASRKLFNTLN
ncbi:MAG: hypothetical protein JWN56_973 [Sphingobacteriales bacterium]|nr:hypothetical protein [Sphingobacteriales bacterium]